MKRLFIINSTMYAVLELDPLDFKKSDWGDSKKMSEDTAAIEHYTHGNDGFMIVDHKWLTEIFNDAKRYI